MEAKPSKPFSNGSEYEYFYGAFCERCKKAPLESNGIGGDCKLENALAIGSTDNWPAEAVDIVQISGHSHVCINYESDDAELMNQYRALFGNEQPCT